jgi:hypothetical protein
MPSHLQLLFLVFKLLFLIIVILILIFIYLYIYLNYMKVHIVQYNTIYAMQCSDVYSILFYISIASIVGCISSQYRLSLSSQSLVSVSSQSVSKIEGGSIRFCTSITNFIHSISYFILFHVFLLL